MVLSANDTYKAVVLINFYYYIHFQTYILGEGMNLFISYPSYELNSTPAVHL